MSQEENKTGMVQTPKMITDYTKRVNRSEEEIQAERIAENFEDLKDSAVARISRLECEDLVKVVKAIERTNDRVKKAKKNLKLAEIDLSTDNYQTYIDNIKKYTEELKAIDVEVAVLKTKKLKVEAIIEFHKDVLSRFNK